MRRIIIVMAAGFMITASSTKANLSNTGFETGDRSYFTYLESGPGQDIFTIMPPELLIEGGWGLSLDAFFDSEDSSFDPQDCFAGPTDSGNLFQTVLYDKSGWDFGDYGADAWRFNALSLPQREIENLRDQHLDFITALDNIFFSCKDIDKGVVPAPDAIFLGGIGACLVSWLRRRRTL